MKKWYILCVLIPILFLIGIKAYSNGVLLGNDEQIKTYYKNNMIKAFQSEDWEKLEQLAKDAIKRYPDFELAYFSKGLAQDELGDYKEAIEAYTNAISHAKPDKLFELYQNRGLAYLHDKQYDKSIADYDLALKLKPSDELAKKQRERAIQEKSGIVIEVSQNGKNVNYRYVKDPIYLGQEYQNAPPRKKQEIQNKVKNFEPDVLPVYYIAVADDILPKDKDLASLLYAIGRYRSMQDVFVCKDRSAAGAVQMEPLLAPNTVKYMAEKDVKYRAKITKKVLDWDIKNPNRPSPEWICYHGVEVFINNGKITTDKQQFDAKKFEVRAHLEKFVLDTLGK